MISSARSRFFLSTLASPAPTPHNAQASEKPHRDLPAVPPLAATSDVRNGAAIVQIRQIIGSKTPFPEASMRATFQHDAMLH